MKDIINFTIEYFSELRIHSYNMPLPFSWKDELDNGLREVMLKSENRLEETFRDITSSSLIKDNIFLVTDELNCKYITIYLKETNSVLISGPFSFHIPSMQKLRTLMKKYNIDEAYESYLKHYFLNMPYLKDELMLHSYLNLVGKKLGLNRNDIKYINVSTDPDFILNDGSNISPSAETMEIITARYRDEENFMNAIATGNLDLADTSFQGDLKLERRLQDTIRDERNYLIIFNTLCRKAAQRGKVHPIYLDEISSKFAAKIEQERTVEGCKALRKEMIRKYCLLVRNHSTRGYSPIIQKVVNDITMHLSENITLGSLAEKYSINSSYLSSTFKKEIGMNITTFILNKKMERAIYLLNSTDENIQTIALNCGYSDLNYFTKCFKKTHDMTPTEYRNMLKKDTKTSTD